MAIFDKTESEEQKTVPGKKGVNPSFVRGVLIKPRTSEKSSQSKNAGRYIFDVTKDANKISIRRAVEMQYNVKVVRVNTVTTEGKHRNYGKTSGKMSDFKKAIVTLKDGDKIELGETI